MAAIMNAIIERNIIHKEFADDLKDDWYYVGMIVPLEHDKFCSTEDLSNQAFLLVRHHPWGVVSKKMLIDSDWEKYSKNSLAYSCPIESMLMTMNLLVYKNGLSKITRGLPEHILKYFGCVNCKNGQSHAVIPVSHFLGDPAVHQIPIKSLTFAGIFNYIEQLADKNIYYRKICSWIYINMISCGAKIMQLPNYHQVKTNFLKKQHGSDAFIKNILTHLKLENVNFKTDTKMLEKDEDGLLFLDFTKLPELEDQIKLHNRLSVHQSPEEIILNYRQRPIPIISTNAISQPCCPPAGSTKETEYWLPDVIDDEDDNLIFNDDMNLAIFQVNINIFFSFHICFFFFFFF